jgi:hypothetical protein
MTEVDNIGFLYLNVSCRNVIFIGSAVIYISAEAVFIQWSFLLQEGHDLSHALPLHN